jgi:hypothetical protein
MTAEQAKQYEICKTRRHEELAPDPASMYQNQLSPGPTWKICRWCGTQYREVVEMRQVERA